MAHFYENIFLHHYMDVTNSGQNASVWSIMIESNNKV